MGRSNSSSKKNYGLKKAKKSPVFNGGIKFLVIVIIAGLALGTIFYFSNSFEESNGDNGSAGKYPYKIGKPDPGMEAPNILLPSSDGTEFDLSSFRGQTVLLYFQEGIMCQPCWDQLKEIELSMDQFKALGIDQIVSITTDPLHELKQKVKLEQLTTPVLSDRSVEVSEAYTTNRYGMMGKNYNGHSFIVVGPDGIIKWRADYGGSPKYTMYLPVPNLIADMSKGLDQGGSDENG